MHCIVVPTKSHLKCFPIAYAIVVCSDRQLLLFAICNCYFNFPHNYVEKKHKIIFADMDGLFTFALLEML